MTPFLFQPVSFYPNHELKGYSPTRPALALPTGLRCTELSRAHSSCQKRNNLDSTTLDSTRFSPRCDDPSNFQNHWLGSPTTGIWVQQKDRKTFSRTGGFPGRRWESSFSVSSICRLKLSLLGSPVLPCQRCHFHSSDYGVTDLRYCGCSDSSPRLSHTSSACSLLITYHSEVGIGARQAWVWIPAVPNWPHLLWVSVFPAMK